MNATSQTVFRKHFARVSVEPHESGLYVSPVWSGVDRPDVGGWVVSAAIAPRLAAAVVAGAAFVSVDVRTDVNGRTYVNAAHAVIGRGIGAALKRLGY